MFKRFGFEFWPTITTIFMVTVLLSLGFWQLHRLEYKNAILEDIQTKLDAAPSAFPPALGNLRDMQYKKYTLYGDFLYENNMFFYGGNPNNPSQHGYFVLTPFITNDGTRILVDRGWIFPTDIGSFLSKIPKYEPVQITAVLMIPSAPNDLTPKNDRNRNIWFSIDLESMSEFSGQKLAKGFYMSLVNGKNKEKEELLIKPSTKDFYVHIKNDHLLYAITWFSLAIALLGIFFVYHKK
ncbi:MAG: SURF1 family protein [Pseudomonadota bacterium]